MAGEAYTAWCADCHARGGTCTAQRVAGTIVTVCRLPSRSLTSPWVYEPAPLAVQLEVGGDRAVEQAQILAGQIAAGAEAVLKPIQAFSNRILVAVAVVVAVLLFRDSGRR